MFLVPAFGLARAYESYYMALKISLALNAMALISAHGTERCRSWFVFFCLVPSKFCLTPRPRTHAPLSDSPVPLRHHAGRPQWNSAYLQRIVRDELFQHSFATLLFWTISTPMIHGLAAAVLRAFFTVLVTASQRGVPLPSFLAHMLPLQHEINAWVALAEVLTGFTLVLYLVTPNRNIMFLFIFWQYLRMRYMLNSPSVHSAFYRAGDVFNAVVTHRFCPGVLKKAYDWLRAKAWTFVDPAEMQKQAEAAQNGTGGIMSKCSIM